MSYMSTQNKGQGEMHTESLLGVVYRTVLGNRHMSLSNRDGHVAKVKL